MSFQLLVDSNVVSKDNYVVLSSQLITVPLKMTYSILNVQSYSISGLIQMVMRLTDQSHQNQIFQKIQHQNWRTWIMTVHSREEGISRLSRRKGNRIT